MQTQVNGALVVTAPVAGVVATQMAKPGQAIQLGQPLLSVVPGDGHLEAELLVPSRAIGFIALEIPCCCAIKPSRIRSLVTSKAS